MMWHEHGFHHHGWHQGMRWMEHGFWGVPGYWGWGHPHHRPGCCCLFFALPLMLLPFLALAALALRLF
jgi:hypothetical protein